MSKIERKLRKFLAGWSVDYENYREELENLVLKVTPLNDDHFKVPFYVVLEAHSSRSYVETGELFEANIRLEYSLVQTNMSRSSGSKSGDFRASYKASGNQLSLTDRAVFLGPTIIQGNHIGTYLFDRIVSWAKEWKDADVDSIGLSRNQATDANKERRNLFYERFGLEFEYGGDREWGNSRPIKAKDLKNVDSWRHNIEPMEPTQLLQSLLSGKMHYDQNLEDKQILIDERAQKIKNFRDSPISAGLMVALYNKFLIFGNRVNDKYL